MMRAAPSSVNNAVGNKGPVNVSNVQRAFFSAVGEKMTLRNRHPAFFFLFLALIAAWAIIDFSHVPFSSFSLRFVITHLSLIGLVSCAFLFLFHELIARQQNVLRAAKENEEHFRGLYDGSPLAYHSLDKNGNLMIVNNAWLAMLGYAKDEVVGRNFGDFLSEGSRALFRQWFPKFKQIGQVNNVEFEMVRKDAARFFVSVDGKISRTPDGSFLQTHCVLREITEQKKRDDALRESEARYRQLFETSRDGIAVTDLQGNYVACNKAYLDLLGYHSLDALKSKSYREITPVEYHGIEEKIITEQTIPHGYCDEYEKEYFHAFGGRIPVSLKAWLRYDSGGKPVGMWAIVRDIAERKTIERALFESERRFREVLENVQLLALMLDKQGNVLFCNKFALDTLGRPEDEVRGRNWFLSFVPAGEGARIKAEYEKRLAKGMLPGHFENDIMSAGGEIRCVKWNITQLKNDNGDIIGSTSIGEDITERKRSEETLRRSEMKFRSVVESAPWGMHFYQLMPDGRLIFTGYNTAADTILGIAHARMVGKTVEEAFPGLKGTEGPAAYKKVAADGGSWQIDQNAYDAEGISGIYEVRAFQISRGHVVVSFLDISKRKQAEDALRLSEAKWRSVIEQSLEGVVLSDEQGMVIEWNSAMVALTGIPKDEALGKKRWDVQYAHLSDEQKKNISPAMLKAIPEEILGGRLPSDRVYENTSVSRDGTRRTIQSRAFPIHSDTEKFLCSVLRDVTALKQAEEALRESEVRYRMVIDNINMGILLLNKNREVLALNRQAAEWRQLKVQREHLICHRDLLIPESERTCPDCPTAMTFVDGKPHEAVREKGEGKEKRYFRIISYPYPAADGSLFAAIVIEEDITEKKKAEQEVLTYQEKLKSLSLEIALLEERERRRVANYLHDQVSQSLVMALMRLSTLRQEAPEAMALELDALHELVGHSVEDIRSLTFELSPPLLYDLGYKAAAEWLAEQFQQLYGIPIDVTADSSDAAVDNEVRAILFRATREVLFNTVKHAQATRAKIAVSVDKSVIRVTVEDNGKGFDAARLLENKKNRGYGLFSVKEQLANLNGSMTVTSAPGSGTRVEMAAPLRMKRGRG
ncbi:MAG: hypothetical protein A2293_05750 [Elusimicrobia bacterium RIFOXYB2_FULL_49_7]|nr:MAG: hypothetical protein A2293_05750 [Elusimicrobia bacterium RIFOXYB2_FULL_49_7]